MDSHFIDVLRVDPHRNMLIPLLLLHWRDASSLRGLFGLGVLEKVIFSMLDDRDLQWP